MRARPAAERFMEKIDVSREPEGCWLWTAKLNPNNSYGEFWPSHGKTMKAHRFAYELFVGPIPVGMTLDHTCHTRSRTCTGGPACLHRRCVNPDHLEPVTAAENVRRIPDHVRVAAYCGKGHLHDADNTYIQPKTGRRRCKTCDRAAARLRWAAKVTAKRAAA